ncbi:hypothetical protein C7212DRAFT_311083, partial [Tuber magnatum]
MQGEEKVKMEKQEMVERRNRRGIQKRKGETEGTEDKVGKGKERGDKERKKRELGRKIKTANRDHWEKFLEEMGVNDSFKWVKR